MSLDDANELLMGGGVRSFQFNQLGDTCTGQIVDQPKVEDCYKMKFDAQARRWERTDELDKWPSGETKRQIVLTVQTEQRADPDDDGRRILYIHSRIQGAMRDAVKASGAKGLAIGGTVTVTWSSGAGTQDGGPKLYTCRYSPPSVDPGALLPAQQPAAATSPAPATNGAAAAVPPPPPGVDANVWAQMTPAQRQAILAAVAPATPAAPPPPVPAGIDPATWAALPDIQRQAILAAMAPAGQPAF
ncbi:hypothetical protein EDC02_5914 [Micromonospora sp. Llam0]|uniref:hypothetical protein n=1 Tax=Micromonospora sp. Llam0 TaxID=2485143 RepID=UPI000FACCC42|nr:hypothetical protein [Micromonospora sp. Llam0]ROO51050.1 hypothetical protein EDC02_5914 [Micromonospora sp. Llam0]